MIPQAVIDKLQTISPKWSPTMYKITLGTPFVLAIVVPLLLVSIPMIEFFNGMAAQPKARSQMTYGRVFGAEILVDRDPVPGTIHRDYRPYPFAHLGNTIEEAQQVGEELENPIPLTRASLERGQKVFTVFCMACHGAEGHGDGPTTGPERFPAASSFHTDQARGYRDGTLFHIVTKGLGKMPSYAYQIEPDDRWKAIQYVRALQRAMNPKPEDLTE